MNKAYADIKMKIRLFLTVFIENDYSRRRQAITANILTQNQKYFSFPKNLMLVTLFAPTMQRSLMIA